MSPIQLITFEQREGRESDTETTEGERTRKILKKNKNKVGFVVVYMQFSIAFCFVFLICADHQLMTLNGTHSH